MRDVTVQILALEDAFKRNEKEQERRARLADERNQRSLFEKIEQNIVAPEPAPAAAPIAQFTEQMQFEQPAAKPVQQAATPTARRLKSKPRAEQVVIAPPAMQNAAEHAEETRAADDEKITGERSAPSSNPTVRLLSPTYNKF
jgi:hypothetical protein